MMNREWWFVKDADLSLANSIYCGTGSCVINSFYSVVGCCSSSSVTDCTTIATSCLPSRSASRASSGDTRMQLWYVILSLFFSCVNHVSYESF